MFLIFFLLVASLKMKKYSSGGGGSDKNLKINVNLKILSCARKEYVRWDV